MKKSVVVIFLALSFGFNVSHGADIPLHPNVKAAIDSGNCNKITRCGEYVEVSCHPEVDGSLNYYNNTTGEQIMRCGGVCDAPSRSSTDPKACKACPPPQWSACPRK